MRLRGPISAGLTPSAYPRRFVILHLSRCAAMAVLLVSFVLGAGRAGTVSADEDIASAPSLDADTEATAVTLPADRDSWLKSNNPGDNFGSQTELPVQTKGRDAARSVFHFDVASIPSGMFVERATINLWVLQSSNQVVTLHRITDAWAEDSVTWSNTATDLDSAGITGFSPSDNGRFVAVDVTSLVQAWVDGAFANHGIMLVGGSKETKYASREWSNAGQRPFLDVTYSVPNTPTPVPPTNTPTPVPPTNTPGPPTPTYTPGPPTPTPGPHTGLWISRAEVQTLPMSGTAWNALLSAANGGAGAPTVCDQDSDNSVIVLAKALVYVRTGTESYRTEVRQNVMAAIGTEDGPTCRTLALGRELAAYVIAADLAGLTASEDAAFRSWLGAVRNQVLAGDGRSLISCHEDRPNNWGTMCGASRAAASAYLGDTADLARTAQVFKGYLGDRASYAGFNYGSDLSWHLDPNNPRGINPSGAVKQGTSIDGVLPDDMRRGGSFTPGCPAATGYPWEALQGVVVQAELLYRQGYDAWSWQSQAERRAVQYLRNLDGTCGGWWAGGDDAFTPWIINHVYGTSFPTSAPVNTGKIMGWTDWTHNRATRPRQ